MLKKLQIAIGIGAMLCVVPTAYYFFRADDALAKYVEHARDCEQRYNSTAPDEQVEPDRYERYFYTCDTSHRGSQISRLKRERDAFGYKARRAASVCAGLLTLVLVLYMLSWFQPTRRRSH